MNTFSPVHPIRETWLRLSRSQFFVISLLFHLLLVVFFGGKALFNTLQSEPDMVAYSGEIVFTDTTPPISLPPSQFKKAQPAFDPTHSQAPATPTGLQTITSRTSSDISLPQNLTSLPNRSHFIPESPAPSLPGLSKSEPVAMSRDTRELIGNFTKDWSSSQPSGKLRDRTFHFTAYVAKYSGGDWAATVQKSGDKITGGSLPNLLYLMNAQSRNKIQATPDPVAIDLASDRLFTVKPPFIFFSGHRDFTLTDLEVENLRRYIRLGGCIWGDSSLPGQRSRFDLAFRREMKRILPDADKNFASLPEDHPIFTHSYYQEINTLPPGLNHYREPIQALTYQDRIAILYTANDYGDLWQIGLDNRWQVDLRKDANNRFVAINPTIWDQRDTYFRGLERESIVNSFKFGTNIVIHLLTRWDDLTTSVGAL